MNNGIGMTAMSKIKLLMPLILTHALYGMNSTSKSADAQSDAPRGWRTNLANELGLQTNPTGPNVPPAAAFQTPVFDEKWTLNIVTSSLFGWQNLSYSWRKISDITPAELQDVVNQIRQREKLGIVLEINGRLAPVLHKYRYARTDFARRARDLADVGADEFIQLSSAVPTSKLISTLLLGPRMERINLILGIVRNSNRCRHLDGFIALMLEARSEIFRITAGIDFPGSISPHQGRHLIRATLSKDFIQNLQSRVSEIASE